MKSFMNENFLLSNQTAELLYHNYAKNMPIIDYHCHLIRVKSQRTDGLKTLPESG